MYVVVHEVILFLFIILIQVYGSSSSIFFFLHGDFLFTYRVCFVVVTVVANVGNESSLHSTIIK